MNQTGDLLARAGEFLRAAPEPGWDAIAARVIAAVHDTPRPGRPLLADWPDHPGHSHLYISENVVRSALAITLRQRYLCAPTSIEFDIDGDTLTAVYLKITGSYGTELLKLADAIRATTAETVVELLGAIAANHSPIDITVTDVVKGDPLYT